MQIPTKLITITVMAKKNKRRKVDHVQLLTNLHNLTGFQNLEHEDESLAACLAEFQQATNNDESDQAGASPAVQQTPRADSTTGSVRSRTSRSWEEEQLDKDRIETWNRSVLAWATHHGGNYPPGLLPNIEEEIARHFHVQESSKFLLEQGNDLRMPMFERWLLDSRLEDSKSRDPIFPMTLLPQSSAACHRLSEELAQNGLNTEKVREIVGELCRKVTVAGQELAAKSETYHKTSPLKKGDRMDLEDHNTTVTLIYSRKKWKKPFCFSLNKSHYQKLKDRFFHLHTLTTTKLDPDSKNVIRAFHLVVVALMLRYSSMSGGQLLQDLRGGGMQGAIHEKVFDVLRETWDGPWIEGFASPLNVFLPTYGSAFPDLDWHFGSIGSFWDTSYVRKGGCCCEANPPFSPGLMTKMVDHIHDQLKKADRLGTRLTFVVVVPTAGSGKDRVVQKAALDSFKQMTDSPWCRKHIKLSAREHGYIEGAQHLRTTKYKQSSYDTSVILLQSTTSKQMDLDERNFEKKIRGAFASQHDEELKTRRDSSRGH